MTTGMISSGDVAVPPTRTTVYEAIFGRRMTKEFTDEAPPREALERMFDAAVWAPNHRLTEPWRFIALERGGGARRRVAELARQVAYDKVANPNPEQKRASADAAKDRVLNAPALVYAYSAPGRDEETTRENYASVCCAVHNMALAAVAEGYTLDWSTGSVAQHPDLAQALGASEDWALVGAIFIGKPATAPSSRRREASSSVSWLN